MSAPAQPASVQTPPHAAGRTARRPRLSVFFPCFNEVDNLERVVGEALGFLPTVADDFEIIVVDDGSTDGTAALADALAARDGRVRAVHHDRNRGYGAALRTGFAAARGELVFYTDGDGQFDIADLPRLLAHIEQFDIVSGYRRRRADGLLRRVNAYCWGWLVRRVLGVRSRDVDSAFKLYRRRIFDRIEPRSTGALIDAEVLARAARAGFTFTEVPVTHRPRVAGQQSGARPAVVLRAFGELLRLRRDICRRPRGVEETT